jgi:uncharacterized membrane protein YcaP (DUF421 family)
MRYFVFIYILAMLGAIVFLTVQYSFWVACVITYIFTMLVIAVNAYIGGSRPSWKTNSKVLNHKPEEIIAKDEGQVASEALKAA